MIDIRYVRLMARYNRWQNRSLVAATDRLDDAARRLDRGAFFRSIHGTFAHLAWGDTMWMHRFAGTPKPAGGIKESPDSVPDWQTFKTLRAALDEAIVGWADELDGDWLVGDLTWYSGAAGRELSRPRALLVAHFFNHQTHHRGQIHAMLTAAGAKPEDTDLMVMPGLKELLAGG